MFQNELNLRRDHAITIAKGAGTILRAGHGKLHDMTWKARDDFKTEVDDASEVLITRYIKQVFPSDSVCAEEGHNTKGDSIYTWYIDPLDGTKEYMLGFSNYFAVSIGVSMGVNALAGVIDIPLREEVYYSDHDSAYCQIYNKQKRRIDQVSVTAPDKMSHAIITVQNGKEKSSKLTALALQEYLTGKVAMIPRIGSAAVCLALLASGKLHGYIGFGLEPWDIVGGVAIVQAAGGCVSKPDGSPWFPHNDSLVAAHPAFHQKLLDFLCQ